jgi:hypothetical protein
MMDGKTFSSKSNPSVLMLKSDSGNTKKNAVKIGVCFEIGYS